MASRQSPVRMPSRMGSMPSSEDRMRQRSWERGEGKRLTVCSFGNQLGGRWRQPMGGWLHEDRILCGRIPTFFPGRPWDLRRRDLWRVYPERALALGFFTKYWQRSYL